MYDRSRYEASVVTEECNGCKKCMKRCQLDAIKMVKVDAKLKASVTAEKCWGCGVCILKSETGAIAMKAVRLLEFIPEGAA